MNEERSSLRSEKGPRKARSPLGTRTITVGDPGQAFTTIAGRDQASSTNKFESKFEQIFLNSVQRQSGEGRITRAER